MSDKLFSIFFPGRLLLPCQGKCIALWLAPGIP